MLAISLTQPWCTLVARGLKPVENRSQLFSVLLGKTFGLHASLKWDEAGAAWIADHFGHDPDVMAVLRGEHRRGQILGLARARGYLEGNRYWDQATQAWWKAGDIQPPFEIMTSVGAPTLGHCLGMLESHWYFGKDPSHKQKYGILLDSQRELTRPVTCKGALGVWVVPEAIRDDIAEQVGGRPWA